MVYQLVYSSSARSYLTAAAAQRIAQVSAERNTRLGITGMLLYLDGTILQVLEGERDKVQALYNLIEMDNRHKSPMILLQRDIPAAEFDGWAMGFRDMSAGQLPDGMVKATASNIAKILPDARSSPRLPALLRRSLSQ